MKNILKIILGAIVLFALISELRLIGHYDSICFYSTVLATVILIIINERVGE